MNARWLPSLLLCIAATSLASRPTLAYTGGPVVVDVLGWDAKAGRLYFHTIAENEAYEFGGVYYFDLAGKTGSKRVQVAWSVGEADANDADHVGRLATLRKRLVPLLPKPGPGLGWGVFVLKADSVKTPGFARVRYRLSLDDSEGARFEWTGYERPDGCVKNVYAIPGHKDLLYVLAIRGNEYDSAETQVAVLVPAPTDRPIPVTWERDR